MRSRLFGGHGTATWNLASVESRLFANRPLQFVSGLRNEYGSFRAYHSQAASQARRLAQGDWRAEDGRTLLADGRQIMDALSIFGR